MNVSLPSFPYAAICLDNPLAIGFARISSVCDNVGMASGVAETLWIVWADEQMNYYHYIKRAQGVVFL